MIYCWHKCKKGGLLDLNAIKNIAGKVVVTAGGLAFVFLMLCSLGGFDTAKGIFNLFATMFVGVCKGFFTALF